MRATDIPITLQTNKQTNKPGVRYYQYNNDVQVSAPAKSFMEQNQTRGKHKRTQTILLTDTETRNEKFWG